MYNKVVNYVDFDGNERRETLQFNVTETELRNFELSMNGGIHAYLEKLVEKLDLKSMSQFLNDFVDLSYGEKSLDGRRFVKNPQILEDFKSSLAYDTFMNEMLHDDKAAAAFINGIFPKQLLQQAKKASLEQKTNFANLGSDKVQEVLDSIDPEAK